MARFKAIVTEDVQANRLLSLAGGNGVPEISVTTAGETPYFHSTRSLETGSEVMVDIKNNPIWEIEAGEDIPAGANVEAGEGGVVVQSEGEGFGYLAEDVNAGGLAKVVRKSQGLPGPRGPQGPQGPEGPQGPAGADGADGVSVVGASSDGTNIIFELSDGSSIEVPWPEQ